MENRHLIHREKPRITTLDSLRGFAALSVVLCHLTSGLFYNKVFQFSPLFILVNGHGAVIFFFVLSGYVLTYQYGNDPNYKFGNFLIVRFVRLYIPYIASIALSLLLKAICDTQTQSNLWLTKLWKEPVVFSDILGHVSLVTNFNTGKLNGVIWSLVHEMRIAFLFPLLLFISKLKVRKALIVSVIIYFGAMTLDILKFNASAGYINSYIYTFIFLYTFSCGALIASYQKQIVVWYNKLRSLLKWVYIVTGICLYSYAWVIPHIVLKAGFTSSIHTYSYDYAIDIGVTAASVIFLIVAIAAKPIPIFTARWSVFLGKISYSFYLTHIPVSVFIVYSLINKLSPVAIVLIALICSILVAVIFNKFIERPAMRLGKKLLRQ